MDENAALPNDPKKIRQSKVKVNDTTRGQPWPPARQPQFSALKAFQSVISLALLVATLFTLWTPANLFSNDLLDRMFQSVQAEGPVVAVPTSTQSPRPRIGLVAGHWGHDSGAVCADGLTEQEVNLRIATLTQQILTEAGYDVELLKEFDTRLTEYQSLALVSIHNDSCEYVNDQATGFKVAAAKSSLYPEKAQRLTACLSQRYQSITGLSFHYNTVTNDMTNYHAFNEIHADTTAAIIETGFLNLDREILTKNTDLIAQGVASGILCYVRNEDVPELPAPVESP